MKPIKILQKILKIIGSDVELIANSSQEKKTMDPDQALTLVRYANALSTILDEEEKARNRQKKEYNKLSTRELLALYELRQGESESTSPAIPSKNKKSRSK